MFLSAWCVLKTHTFSHPLIQNTDSNCMSVTPSCLTPQTGGSGHDIHFRHHEDDEAQNNNDVIATHSSTTYRKRCAGTAFPKHRPSHRVRRCMRMHHDCNLLQHPIRVSAMVAMMLAKKGAMKESRVESAGVPHRQVSGGAYGCPLLVMLIPAHPSPHYMRIV